MSSTLNVGVIGLGFMGQTHVRCVHAAREAGLECALAAVSDRNAERLSGAAHASGNLDTGAGAGERLFDPASVRVHADPRKLIDDPGVDLVSICTPTDTHADLVLTALKAGKHVLCEKPVALDSTDVREIAEVAYRTGKLCMPAMCMRFWPGWTELKARVTDGSLGAVISATFQRLGCPPAWSPEFYRDASRSGGALSDLHVHDADFVYWLFGKPDEVVSTGTLSHVSTFYRYDEHSPRPRGLPQAPTHVLAEGGQDYTPPFGYRMRYAVAFERGTMEFDLGRTPQLVVSRDGRNESPTLSPVSGYDAQLRHLIDMIRRGKHNEDLIATIDDAVAVTKLLEAERESIERGRPSRPG